MNIDFLKKALSESDGSPSAMRIMVFYCVILFATITGLGFIKVLFANTSIVIEYVMALLTFLAAALGLKAYQKKVESGTPNSASASSTESETTTKVITKTSTPNGQDGDIDTTKKTDTTNKE